MQAKTLFIRSGAATGDTRATIGREPDQATWEWNGEILTAKTDRLGLQSVFYRRSDGFFAISSSLDALRQEGDAFDWDALGLFLRLGYYLNNDTPFHDICLAPADSTLHWSDGVLTVETRQRPRVEPFTGSRQRAIETYIDLFRLAMKDAMANYPEGPVSCPLSGGRDSRHIFLELTRLARPFQAFTVDLRVAGDASIPADLCAQYGVPHTTVPRVSSSLARSRAMESTMHYATMEHRWMTGLADVIPQGAVFDGVAGDILSAGLFASEKKLSQFRSGHFEDLAASLQTMVDDKALRALLNPWLYEKISGANVRRRLVTELARHAGEPNPIAAFFLANRTRRVTSLMTTTLFAHCVGLRPYLHEAVCEFLISLPCEMTVDGGFHSEAISRAFPECRHRYARKRRPDASRRFMAEALMASASWRGIANMHFLLPRVSRGLIDGAYSARSEWMVDIVAYIDHIGVGRR